MTKALLLALSAAALGLSALHAGAASPSPEAKQICFEKHAKLLSKPALKNLRDCWQAHGYLQG